MRNFRNMFLFLVLPLMALGLVSLTAKRSAPAVLAAPAAQPNIIYIVVDALRSDHVSAYGYGRSTTPTIDTLFADEGALFSDVTAASSWTNPSNGAMLLGRLPSEVDTVWADPERRIPDSETLLAEYLSAVGYQTVGFVSNWWVTARFGYGQGFDTYLETTGPDKERASTLNNLAQTWLEAHKGEIEADGRPLFLFLYYYDPHSWYDPPPPYDTLYDPDYTGSLTPAVFGHGEGVVSGAIVPSPRDIEHLLALYDGEITYWDSELSKMVAYLDGLGLWQDSLIVFTSDHGQMFGEHGKWVHRNSLYEEVLRVPLVIRYPAVIPPGQVQDTPVSNLDILPTILDLAGINRPSVLEGMSLAPIMQGAAPPPARQIFAEMAGETDPAGDGYWIAPHTNLYSVKEDGWKYTHALQEPELDSLAQVGPASVYEGPNMIAQEPAIAAELWDSLQTKFGIPTQFLFLPAVERP